MDMQLQGKRALVTGSSSGLGEAIAKALASEGATVIVHGRDGERAHRVAAAIVEAGGRAEVALGDLSHEEGADAVASAASAGGRIDILVNNAGAYHHLEWLDTPLERWNDTYQTNVLSGVRMIKRFVPAMREARWGRVIQIGGGLATQPTSMQPDYAASLAARHNIAVSLARSLRETGVTSNVVSPGAILVGATRALLSELAPTRGWTGTWEQIEQSAVREFVPNDVGRMGRVCVRRSTSMTP